MQRALQPDYSKMNTKAIEKFLERQMEARQRKEVSEERKKQMAGSGLNWQNKVTIPITPRIMKNESSKAKLSRFLMQEVQLFTSRDQSHGQLAEVNASSIELDHHFNRDIVELDGLQLD